MSASAAIHSAKGAVKDFTGKVVFITGGASGIGRATAEILAARGAKLALIDVNAPLAGRAAEALREEYGVECLGIGVDVAKHGEVEQAIKQTVRRLGGLDGALNAAGMPAWVGKGQSLHEYSIDKWKTMLDVNCNGVFYCVRAQINQFLKAKTKGSIVNISSSAGMRAIWQGSAYVASKHAVIGITQSAALEYSQFGIRTNSIAPGHTKTPMLAAAGEDALAEMGKGIPMGRLAEPEEIGELAAFLLSDKASYVSGGVYGCDGGYLTAGPGALVWDDKTPTRNT